MNDNYKIKLIKNEAPNLGKVDFLCDEKICKSLDKWPLIRDHMNKYNTTAIIGRQGSGKTNLTINIVKRIYKKKFHHIYVFMPQTSRNSLKDNIFEALPEDQLYEELNAKVLFELHEKIKKNAEEGEKSLIIFDDVQKALKDGQTLMKLKEMIANQRHIKLVNLILVQNFFQLDRSIREIINNIILFKLDKGQTEKIFNDAVELHKDKFEVIRNIVFDKPYEWMFINKSSQRIYKGFDEIVIVDDDDDDNIEKTNHIEDKK
jgi:ABC-type dipeptide/oligopeptide/nickel transport system ATPase component